MSSPRVQLSKTHNFNSDNFGENQMRNENPDKQKTTG